MQGYKDVEVTRKQGKLWGRVRITAETLYPAGFPEFALRIEATPETANLPNLTKKLDSQRNKNTIENRLDAKAACAQSPSAGGGPPRVFLFRACGRVSRSSI